MSSRRIEVTGAGGPEVLQLRLGEVPEPRAGEVRVRVEVAGVAYGDVMRRLGVLAPRRPFVPGYDVVGRIDAVGAGVDPERIGARVAVLCRPVGRGGYADHVCAPAGDAVPVPDGLPSTTACALGLNYLTAWQIVHRQLGLAEGHSLLVHGASGGVGTALLDIGRLAGLTLFGTASARNQELVQGRGAIPLDYREHDVVARVREATGGGVDAVTDPIGGAHLLQSAAAVRRGGTVVFFGLTGDVARGLGAVLVGLGSAARVWATPGCRLRAYGITVPPVSTRARCVADQQTLFELGLEGLRPLLAEVVPLEQAAAAHRMLEDRTVAGKVLLSCA